MKKIYEAASIATAIIVIILIGLGFASKVHDQNKKIKQKKHYEKKIEKRSKAQEEAYRRAQECAEKERERIKRQLKEKQESSEKERERLKLELEDTRLRLEQAREINKEFNNGNIPSGVDLSKYFPAFFTQGERKDPKEKSD